MNYDGTSQIVVRKNLPNPLGISIFKEDMFWIDKSLGALFKTHKGTDDVIARVLKGGLHNLVSIAMYDEDIQPAGKM